MRRGSSLRGVVASAVLASAVQLGCGPAVEGAGAEGVERESLEGAADSTGMEVPDALDVPDEGEAMDGGLAPQGHRDGWGRGWRRRVRICHFPRWWDDDHDDDGIVLRLPWRAARRHLYRHGDCVIRDDERAGDRCDRDDCRDHDWDDDHGWDD